MHDDEKHHLFLLVLAVQPLAHNVKTGANAHLTDF